MGRPYQKSGGRVKSVPRGTSSFADAESRKESVEHIFGASLTRQGIDTTPGLTQIFRNDQQVARFGRRLKMVQQLSHSLSLTRMEGIVPLPRQKGSGARSEHVDQHIHARHGASRQMEAGAIGIVPVALRGDQDGVGAGEILRIAQP
jgi:hypothetical protein